MTRNIAELLCADGFEQLSRLSAKEFVGVPVCLLHCLEIYCDAVQLALLVCAHVALPHGRRLGERLLDALAVFVDPARNPGLGRGQRVPNELRAALDAMGEEDAFEVVAATGD